MLLKCNFLPFQADKNYLVDYAPISDGDDLETSILGLRFDVKSSQLFRAQLSLRCTATIASVYFNQSSVHVRAHLSRRPPYDGPGMLKGKLTLFFT